MQSFLGEAWAFLIRRSGDHPVYRRELSGWSYLGFWRTLRRGCLPLLALILLSTGGCCGILALATGEFNLRDPAGLVIGALSILIGILIGSEIIRWMTGLLATAITATTLSSEIEADTYGLLRLTSVTPRQIVLAKFSAAFHQFRLPLLAVALGRLTFIGGMIVLGAVALAAEAAAPVSPTLPPSPVTPGLPPIPVTVIAGYGLAGAAVVLALVAWLLFYLVEPVLNTLVFAAIGMLASAWARTRSGGLITAVGLRVALWVMSYIIGQAASVLLSLLSFPLMLLSTPPRWVETIARLDPALIVAGVSIGAVMWVLLLVLAQIAVALLLLYAAARRAERLPYG